MAVLNLAHNKKQQQLQSSSAAHGYFVLGEMLNA